jgi:hypothetical protein
MQTSSFFLRKRANKINAKKRNKENTKKVREVEISRTFDVVGRRLRTPNIQRMKLYGERRKRAALGVRQRARKGE